jgi:hypothetical protein
VTIWALPGFAGNRGAHLPPAARVSRLWRAERDSIQGAVPETDEQAQFIAGDVAIRNATLEWCLPLITVMRYLPWILQNHCRRHGYPHDRALAAVKLPVLSPHSPVVIDFWRRDSSLEPNTTALRVVTSDVSARGPDAVHPDTNESHLHDDSGTFFHPVNHHRHPVMSRRCTRRQARK